MRPELGNVEVAGHVAMRPCYAPSLYAPPYAPPYAQPYTIALYHRAMLYHVAIAMTMPYSYAMHYDHKIE